MAFVSYNQLRAFKLAEGDSQNFATKSIIAASARPGIKDIFLSHSTQDDELIDGAQLLFQEYGATTYHDASDQLLPRRASPETAALLKQRIVECRRFVVLVTPNSKNSRWVPWELGVADGAKAYGCAATFPVTPAGDEEPWAKQEYLGLYPRIFYDNLVLKVYDPGDGHFWEFGDWVSAASLTRMRKA